MLYYKSTLIVKMFKCPGGTAARRSQANDPNGSFWAVQNGYTVPVNGRIRKTHQKTNKRGRGISYEGSNWEQKKYISAGYVAVTTGREYEVRWEFCLTLDSKRIPKAYSSNARTNGTLKSAVDIYTQTGDRVLSKHKSLTPMNYFKPVCVPDCGAISSFIQDPSFQRMEDLVVTTLKAVSVLKGLNGHKIIRPNSINLIILKAQSEEKKWRSARTSVFMSTKDVHYRHEIR